jgi:hypothetical protein
LRIDVTKYVDRETEETGKARLALEKAKKKNSPTLQMNQQVKTNTNTTNRVRRFTFHRIYYGSTTNNRHRNSRFGTQLFDTRTATERTTLEALLKEVLEFQVNTDIGERCD